MAVLGRNCRQWGSVAVTATDDSSITATTDSGRTIWRGRVEQSIFRGPRRSMVIDCAGERLNVEAPAMRTASVGDNVVVSVNAASCWAMRI